MKIKIGPYINWWGPYQIADLLQRVGVSKDKCHEIGARLAKTKLNNICEWVHSKRKRTIKIHIDNYDVWGMDTTLSQVILPMLKLLKEKKHGAPWTDDEDVPENLRASAAPPKKNDWDTDENFFKRWDWILAEIIWTFEQLQPECDWEDQYKTGVSDIRLNFEDDADSNGEFLQYGPNHTEKTDNEGIKRHQQRIKQGLILFGKYYQTLWD